MRAPKQGYADVVRRAYPSIRLHALRVTVAREASQALPVKPYRWGQSDPRLRPVVPVSRNR